MKKRGMTRKEFLALTTMGLAGSYLSLNAGLASAMMSGGMGGMGGMGGSSSVIDPPPGDAYRDPAEAVKNSSGVYELEAVERQVNVNGTWANLLTYNGCFPGPTIRARKGESLGVVFRNSLPYTNETNFLGHTKNITNIHTHGLHVSPEAPADSMMVQLKPGEMFEYTYDLSYEQAGHLNFYHPHVHGVVADQYWGGLAGALVLEDEITLLSSFETHVMIIKDLTLSNGAPTPYTSMMEYMHGKEGALVTVNGQVNPVLTIRPGQVQRWQIVNACNARFLKLSLQNHQMYLIGTDGGLVDKPYPLSSILLSPGERVDLLVRGSQKGGTYKFLSLPYSRGGMSDQQQVTLLTLNYGGSSVRQSLPSVINSAAKRIVMDTASLPRKRLTLSMGQGRGYINDRTFNSMTDCYTAMSDLGTWEVWEIVNNSGMDHPFHQHVNSAQILSITGGDSAYRSLYTTIPAWKDVVVVPKMGSVTMLLPVMHWPGMAMFHCHIIEHEDIGMMGGWHIMEKPMPM